MQLCAWYRIEYDNVQLSAWYDSHVISMQLCAWYYTRGLACSYVHGIRMYLHN